MLRYYFIMLTACIISCVNVQTEQISQKININTAISIPKHIALQYANDFLDRNYIHDFYGVTFYQSHATISRKHSKYAPALTDQKYDYAELCFIADIMEVKGGDFHKKQYTVVLIDKKDIYSPDLYHSRFGLSQKVLNPSKYMYAWGEETQKVPRKDFEKFLSSLVSLGIQVRERTPQDY